jgi:hypothetical protein
MVIFRSESKEVSHKRCNDTPFGLDILASLNLEGETNQEPRQISPFDR